MYNINRIEEINMKLLRIVANGYKNCEKDLTISFVPTAQKSAVDKEFELLEIDEGLYTFSTLGIIGKNASGKTTVVELLSIVYDILSFRKLEKVSSNALKYVDSSFNLDITFYDNGFLYRYVTDVEKINNLVNNENTNFIFSNEKIYEKQYFKTNASKIFDYESYSIKEFDSINKPDEISLLFAMFKEIEYRGFYYSCNDFENYNYNVAFNLFKIFDEQLDIIFPVIQMFDENIKDIKMLAEEKYEITFKNKSSKIVSKYELHDILSSGTSKGIVLMSYVAFALKCGVDLIIDEVENHFHKTLVENLINLFKDKTVNKKNATLTITTHYCELLDLFGRSDNIYIAHNDSKIYLENMHSKYPTRSELLKSKKFYNNEFGTNVKYDSLMNFKKELMK